MLSVTNRKSVKLVGVAVLMLALVAGGLLVGCGDAQKVKDLEKKVTDLNGQVTKLTQDNQKAAADLKTAQTGLTTAQADLKKAQDAAAALGKADPAKFVGTWVLTKADGTKQNMAIAKNADNSLGVTFENVAADGTKSAAGTVMGLALPSDRVVLTKGADLTFYSLVGNVLTVTDTVTGGKYAPVAKGDQYKK
jgi:outer membrane murein-binding lipoprotein Lpp